MKLNMVRSLSLWWLIVGNGAWEVQDDPGLLQVRAELNSQFKVKNGGIPDCAWDKDDEACPPFTLGRFTIGLLGVNACPRGTIVVTEALSCAEAAFLTDSPFDEIAGTEGECYWAGQGPHKNKFMMHDWVHDDKAKWVCQWDEQQKHIDSCHTDSNDSTRKDCSLTYSNDFAINTNRGDDRIGLWVLCDGSINWYFDEPVVVRRFQIYTGLGRHRKFIKGGEISLWVAENNLMNNLVAPTGLKMVSPNSGVTWEGNTWIDETDPQYDTLKTTKKAKAFEPDAGRYTMEFAPVLVKGIQFKSSLDKCELQDYGTLEAYELSSVKIW